MPQPVISGAPLTCTFGGLALPNGQGTMTNVNLNDGTIWQWQHLKHDDDYPQIGVGQLAWRHRGTVLNRDSKARALTLPMRFKEATTAGADSLGAALGKLMYVAAGQQQLSFDGSTCILANLLSVKNKAMLKTFSPFYWSLELEFLCPEPWFRDIASTTNPNALALNSGSATTFNVTYAGSIFAEPVWTLTIPGGNAVPIASFTLANTMPNPDEQIVITFPGNLPASTAATITIDSGAMTVVDAHGVSYDVSGTAFPSLYGPAGQVNTMSATLTPASGTATGCTLTGSFQNRWVI